MQIKIMDKTGSAVIDTLGAELMSVKDAQGREYLWQGEAAFWGGRAPVLFPIVGALKDGKTEIEGNSYEMGRHGFARKMEFEVASQSENEVVFSLKAGAESRTMYPYAFELQIRYRFENGVLTNAYLVKNHGSVPMPFAVGGHPAFRVPLAEGEAFEDYDIVFEKKETAEIPLIDMKTGTIDFTNCKPLLTDENVIPLKHSLFEQDALVFDGLNSSKVRLENRNTHNGVEMDFTGFPMLGIWSALGEAPFAALEPWVGCADAPDCDGQYIHKKYIRTLAPGMEAENVFTVTLMRQD